MTNVYSYGAGSSGMYIVATTAHGGYIWSYTNYRQVEFW